MTESTFAPPGRFFDTPDALALFGMPLDFDFASICHGFHVCLHTFSGVDSCMDFGFYCHACRCHGCPKKHVFNKVVRLSVVQVSAHSKAMILPLATQYMSE